MERGWDGIVTGVRDRESGRQWDETEGEGGEKERKDERQK